MFNYICLYCDHHFKFTAYYNQQVRCTKCGDKNVKIVPEVKKINFYPEQSNEKIDGYLYDDGDYS